LRRYHQAGKMQTPIADREVEDRILPMATQLCPIAPSSRRANRK
jgi:hypothetical protein